MRVMHAIEVCMPCVHARVGARVWHDVACCGALCVSVFVYAVFVYICGRCIW